MGGELFHPGPALPGRRSDFVAAATEQALFIVGGCTSPRSSVRETWVLDLRSEKWREGPPIPHPREGMASVQDGRWLVVAGGYLSSLESVATVDAFHLDEERWEERPPLPEPRAWARAALVGRSLHLAGGFRIDRQRADAAVTDHVLCSLDPGAPASWREAAPLPLGVADGTFEFLRSGDRIVWAGGAMGVGTWKREHLFSQPVTGVAFAYDTFHQAWQRLPELPGPRRAHRALALKEGLLVAGGVDDETVPLASAFLLTPDGEWTELDPLPQPRYHFCMLEVGDEVWVLGGNYLEGEAPPTLRVRTKEWLRG